MKRKLLSILLTFCLAFSLLPTAALAEGETANVAEVNGTKYATLQAAVNEADNKTVKLLEDVTESITIPADKTVTLDLNGKKLVNSATAQDTNVVDSSRKHTITNNGTLTILDSVGTGVVDNVSHGRAALYNAGTIVEIKDGKFTRSVDNSTDATSAKGNSWYVVYNAENATISKISGGEFLAVGKFSSLFCNCGSIGEISGGTFTQDGFIAFKNEGTVDKISGGTFASEKESCIQNWGSIGEITGGTITAGSIGIWNFSSDTYSSVGKVGNISGGNISGTTAAIRLNDYDTVYKDNDKNVSKPSETNKASISISAGNFSGALEVGENTILTITGGAFTDIANAVKYAADGATIKLADDVTRNSGMIEVRKPLTVDLNTHKLTSPGGFDIYADLTVKNGQMETVNWAAWVQNGAKLVVDKDVMIKATSTAADKGGIAIQHNGSAVTIYGSVEAAGGNTVSGIGNKEDGGVTINIEDGAVIKNTNEGGLGIYYPNTAELNIKGGTITGATGVYVKSGKTTITGGVINGTGAKKDYEYYGNGAVTTGDAFVVDKCNYPGGDPTVEIKGGYFNSANAASVGSYVGNGATGLVTGFVTGGYFTSDPTAYLAASHYVWASDKDGYAYMVKDNAPTSPEQKITVIDKTDATVSDTIKPEDKTKIEEVKDKANVDGVAEAVTPAKKADIVSKSNANPGDNDKVEIEVAVKVVAKTADLAKGQLTFEASPVATVKVNGAATGTTVPVTNDMLNGQPITVKLPLPTVDGKLFTPEQIKHISSDGSVEYFLKTAKRGAKTFEIKDDCAVFKITKFSTFELSGTVTYVEPSYSSGSSYDPTYSVSTPSKTEHGTVTVSPKSASKGDTVTVTVKPDSGYVLETLTVTDKNGNELTLKDKGNGKYTFTMPAGKVEVKATFMEDNSMLNFFYDVPNNAYFYEAVKWAVKNGITDGVGNNLFAPEQPCTRAQIVTFLWRAAGSPEPKGAASGMTDVVSGSYYEKAVAWAIENGITTGTTTSTFSPDATCTRAQAVTFLARALKAKAASAAEFSDVPTGSYFADAVAWAAANGVTEGIGGGLFGSDNDCTRGQIVTFLYRAYNK